MYSLQPQHLSHTPYQQSKLTALPTITTTTTRATPREATTPPSPSQTTITSKPRTKKGNKIYINCFTQEGESLYHPEMSYTFLHFLNHLGVYWYQD